MYYLTIEHKVYNIFNFKIIQNDNGIFYKKILEKEFC